ncbi:MAG: phenylalanine--tRNA ligase beta subunit-related protein [Breznakibacter sp.]
MNIAIEAALSSLLPDLVLGGFSCHVRVEPSSGELSELVNGQLAQIAQGLTPEVIREMKYVRLTKDAYRKLGKDPNRYRPSAEALLRRVANGRGLYKLGNVVDVLNLMSVKTGYSICGYDHDNIIGRISLGIGEPEEPYIGIGKGDINIGLLPVFRDELSAFGTPTSDSVRTMVTHNTKRLLMVFIGLGNDPDELKQALAESEDLLQKFANAHHFEHFMITAS